MSDDRSTKLLVFGASGMFGHVLWHEARTQGLDVFGTMRRFPEGHEHRFMKDRILLGVDAEHHETVTRALQLVRPDFVVNCIGIVKQSPVINDPIRSISVNSLFPHVLARDCASIGCRLIHISTDCVFSGSKGDYKESDTPDPVDFYGLSKLIGEPKEKNALTVRTSMFGPELGTQHGLLEWFIAQKGKTVSGFANSIFSGFYTRSLARLILQIATRCPKVRGVRHLGAEAIDKYELLKRIREACHLPIAIVPDASVRLNRSLDSTQIRSECRLEFPSWDGMIDQLAADLEKDGRA
jgi:dTDP-4-dehydrorhamnose reductase